MIKVNRNYVSGQLMLFVHPSACSSLGTNYIRIYTRHPSQVKIYLVMFGYLLQPYMEVKLYTLLTPIPAWCLVTRDQPMCKRRSSFQTSTQVNGIFTWSSIVAYTVPQNITKLRWCDQKVWFMKQNRYVTFQYLLFYPVCLQTNYDNQF